ncbi:MAG: C40 family peptidase [Erysipelotrichaceae bacterium]|nr:C40 family peptidase [Erysipelotrichaceae bacterium]
MTTDNGLDCSGFVTWAIYNGGFDCGDIGSGITPGLKALTDIGEMALISETSLEKMKVGDLLHSAYTGGHIGILIGRKGDTYYVAEATPRPEIMALTVSRLNTDQLRRQWNEIVFMDDYYKEDGDLTDMWY